MKYKELANIIKSLDLEVNGFSIKDNIPNGLALTPIQNILVSIIQLMINTLVMFSIIILLFLGMIFSPIVSIILMIKCWIKI